MKKAGIPTYHPTMKGQGGQKGRKYKISVQLPTDEVFTIDTVYNEMKVRELKGLNEFYCGIPFHLQKLHYLDEGKNLSLNFNPIVLLFYFFNPYYDFFNL